MAVPRKSSSDELGLLQVCSFHPSNRSIYGSSWLCHSTIPFGRNVGMADPGATEKGTVRQSDGIDLGQVYRSIDDYPKMSARNLLPTCIAFQLRIVK